MSEDQASFSHEEGNGDLEIRPGLPDPATVGDETFDENSPAHAKFFGALHSGALRAQGTIYPEWTNEEIDRLYTSTGTRTEDITKTNSPSAWNGAVISPAMSEFVFVSEPAAKTTVSTESTAFVERNQDALSPPRGRRCTGQLLVDVVNGHDDAVWFSMNDEYFIELPGSLHIEEWQLIIDNNPGEVVFNLEQYVGSSASDVVQLCRVQIAGGQQEQIEMVGTLRRGLNADNGSRARLRFRYPHVMSPHQDVLMVDPK